MSWVTWAAGRKLPLPLWSAAMVQVPTALPLTVVPPVTVQTSGVSEVKLTVRPELALALAVVMPP